MNHNWAMWRRQALAVLRIDLAKTFFSKRGLWIYLLAIAPAVPMFFHGFFDTTHPLGEDVRNFAGVFQFFYLRVIIFFGCVGVFMNLFRGEMIDKSLHYYLLAPVRREVLVASKFLSGLIAALVIFTASTLLQWFCMFWHFPAELMSSYFFSGPGLSHLSSYLVATWLAVTAYGSVFLAAGVLFRNPLVPAAAILIWESANGILPSLLKKLSVIYWLKSICPISLPMADNNSNNTIFNLLIFDIEPAGAATAVVNLLLLAGFVLVGAAICARRLEITYGSE